MPGTDTSAIEVTNISRHGFWMLIDDRELFLSFGAFPWFLRAEISQVLNVERQGPNHLFWPDLDIDISVESIEHPDRFPLVSKL